MLSSSDGLRVHLDVQAANADPNAAHFHRRKRGITIYLHIADIEPSYRQRMIAANDSEALYGKLTPGLDSIYSITTNNDRCRC